jgi:hypothetical protein
MNDLVRPFASASPHVDDVLAPRPGSRFVPTLSHRADCKPRRSRHRRRSTEANRVRFRPGPQSTPTLVQRRLQQAPLLANELLGVHRRT